jgi:2-oxoglutarate dehydrogenase E2 component (dihydrolipoamide succinyltransferase)
VLPELGMGETPVLASVWLVELGASVAEGERLLEVVAGSATIDLPSPVAGTLVELLVDEDDRLSVGQRLAVIRAVDADSGS